MVKRTLLCVKSLKQSLKAFAYQILITISMLVAGKRIFYIVNLEIMLLVVSIWGTRQI